jgi:hypothetical protein
MKTQSRGVLFGAGVAVIATGVLLFTTARPVIRQDGDRTRADIPLSCEYNGRWWGLCGRNQVRSVGDLRLVVDRDPVLRAHFSGFRWERAEMKTLDAPTPAWVSFRTGDTIFHRSRPLVLPAGDRVITDGIRTVRAYCCNDVVEVDTPPPVRAFGEEQPPYGGLYDHTPMMPRAGDEAGRFSTQDAARSVGSAAALPVVAPVAGYYDHRDQQDAAGTLAVPAPPVPVPEGDLGVMVLIGVAGALGVYRRVRR